MTKRAIGWIGALALLLGLLLCTAAVLSRSHRVRRGLSRVLSQYRTYAAPSQTITPRPDDFLQPQRMDAWRIIGPGGGGTFYFPAISPHDPNFVFATTDMTACFVSENAGRSWRTFNFRHSCKFVFDPKLPNRVYALAPELWRSDDRGHTWTMIYPENATFVGYADDEGEMWTSTTTNAPLGLTDMQVDPDDSNTLYASLSEHHLAVSKNGGKSWRILVPDVEVKQIWIDPTSPRSARTIYTQFGNEIGTWNAVKYVKRAVEGVTSITWAAFGTPSAGGKPVIYIASDYVRSEAQPQATGGILSSTDGGQTWRSLNEGILKLGIKGNYPSFTTIGASRNHAEVVYVSFTQLIPPADPQYYHGLLKSSDGGATWSVAIQEANVTAPTVHNDWISNRFGPGWPDEPLGIGVDDNNPNLVYTTDLGRIMRSVDGGQNWTGTFSQSTGKGFTTTGLDATTCYGVHIDPFDPRHMFISYTDIGLMRSEDGGESWLSATNGVPKGWWYNTYWMEFDPEVKGKMWAVMSNRHDLPRMRMLNMYGGGEGGVALSTDGGHGWKASSRGLPPSVVPTHILLDPKSPVTARGLYVAAYGIGVFKSTDGGQNWVLKNNGLPENEPRTWRMALGSDGTLYVVTIRRTNGDKYGTDGDGWLFRSRDGAESWERVKLPGGVNGPTAITVDPKDPARLYLSAWGRYVLYGWGPPAADGGVYMSSDGGANWQNILNGSRRIYDVTVDPRNSDLVYATGFEAAAWRSADRGKTWHRIGGFNFKGGHRVIPDPTDINKIYITTFGNSVWHGPAAGDPNATEDIIGPPSMKFQAAPQK